MSRTMVELARARARQAGLDVDVRQGDAAHMPLPHGAFDLIVCQAAFKNFGEPVRALDEMHRVLRPGGIAVIQDMDRDCTKADIAEEVRASGVRGWNGWMMGLALRGLRRRAYSAAEFRRLGAASRFGDCAISRSGIGMEIRLRKPA